MTRKKALFLDLQKEILMIKAKIKKTLLQFLSQKVQQSSKKDKKWPI